MGVSKVTLNGDTLMDITSDTVDATNLLTGFTAHGADGESLMGTYQAPTITGQKIYYATCDTAAATAAKVATTTNGDFVLQTGAMVRVKFTNADTYNGTSTLNVDSTNAINIVRVGTTVKARYYWLAGEVVDFVYDGTNFVMLEGGIATTTYYGITKLSSSISSTSTALAATPSAVKQAYDLAAAAAPAATTLAGYNIADAYTKSQVGALVASKADAATTLSGYGITDAYTKTEINSIISSAFTYKGTKQTYSELSALTGMSVGDFWYVIGDNSGYAYNGTTWDSLGSTIDLSPYLVSEDLKDTEDIIYG